MIEFFFWYQVELTSLLLRKAKFEYILLNIKI